MGRKHRSPSVGNAPPTPTAAQSSSMTATPSSATPSHAPSKLDLAAANTLINHFVHGTNTNLGGERDSGGDGRTVFHRAVEHAASSTSAVSVHMNEDSKLDGLFFMEALSTRMRELDSTLLAAGVNISKQADGGGLAASSATTSHLHRLMLARDVESGYTPLHCAVLKRDLMSLLILLGHASSSLNGTDGIINGQMLHPLRLLDGNIESLEADSFGEVNPYIIINELAVSADHENLTPLQLLGRTSASGLEKCRMTLTWKSLRKSWKRPAQNQQGSRRGDMLSEGNNRRSSMDSSERNDDNHPRRYRRRMISFGDDRDYESLNYEIDNDDRDAQQRRERRARSGSFNVDLDDGHPDDDDDEQENGNDAGATNNDFVPLDNVDFNLLANNNNNDDEDESDQQQPPASQQHSQPQPPTSTRKQTHQPSDEYGCEVLTFGRADHCALGVPQFGTTSGRIRERNTEDNFSSSNSTTSYKPKRVETFALGELRRKWSSPDSLSSREEVSNNVVDSPAVSIAASTHHTLIATQSGQLYSFGYGKSGRLGTGDENHRPLPTRILGPLTKRIVASIAAATNHSLCSTNDGKVYAWGSNGFGQLGYNSSSSSSTSGKDYEQSTNNSRLSPRRVEGELKQSFVVAVAAGDRHSVALTKLGEVYCWGDNRSGQLGMFHSSAMAAGNASPSSQTNGRCSHRPQRVEGLWSAQSRRRAIAISAAEFSTLVLTMPPTVSATGVQSSSSSLASLPVNTVYGWGHGNHSVMRVVFPFAGSARNGGNTNSANNNVYCINPTAIACAKYHNVAITADGRVYTWGLHSESLGIEKKSSASQRRSKGNNESDWSTSEGRRPRSNSQSGGNNNSSSSSTSSLSSSSTISSPQLVAGLLPENGGGKAIFVSASESHTAVVTSDGHMFTWGTSHENDVLGHKGVRWQPCPRKVKRVHRAVCVAAAKEHTVLLMGTTFPRLPAGCRSEHGASDVPSSSDAEGCYQPLTLQETAAVEISRNVDMFNVIPISLVAHRLNCRPLLTFCDEFIRKNLDGVLAVGNKSDIMTFLSSRRTSCCLRIGDGTMRYNDYDSGGGTFHPFLYRLANNNKNWTDVGRLLYDEYSGSITVQSTKKAKRRWKKEQQRQHQQQASSIPWEEKKELFKTPESIEKCALPTNIAEQQEVSRCKKSGRTVNKPSDEEQSHQVPNKLFEEKAGRSNMASMGSTTIAADDTTALPKYHCNVCNVSCPDSDSYTLHMHGRKHRNRLSHSKAKKEKCVAESMMAMKRMQLMENKSNRDGDIDGGSGDVVAVKAKSVWANNTTSPHKKSAAVTPRKKDPLLERKSRSKSFQEILKEEHQQRSSSSINGNGLHGKFLSPIATKKQPPALRTSSTIAVPTATSIQPSPSPAAPYGIKSSPIVTLPLSAFMKGSGKQKKNHCVDAMISIGASWGAKPAAASNISTSWGAKPIASNTKTIMPSTTQRHPVPPPSKSKSFSQIQQEEETIRNNEDHICRIDGNQTKKWYVQQRSRAASIGQIQEQEKKDREMHDLIEEQKQIEMDIMKRRVGGRQEKKEEEDKEDGEDAANNHKEEDGRKKQGGRQKKTNNKKKKPNQCHNSKSKKTATRDSKKQ